MAPQQQSDNCKLVSHMHGFDFIKRISNPGVSKTKYFKSERASLSTNHFQYLSKRTDFHELFKRLSVSVRPVATPLSAEFHCHALRSVFTREFTKEIFSVSLILLVASALLDHSLLLARDKGIWLSGSRSLIIISPRISQSVQLNPPKMSSVYTETGR